MYSQCITSQVLGRGSKRVIRWKDEVNIVRTIFGLCSKHDLSPFGVETGNGNRVENEVYSEYEGNSIGRSL